MAKLFTIQVVLVLYTYKTTFTVKKIAILYQALYQGKVSQKTSK